MSKPRLAIVCDYKEENWPSMDLVAEMLLENLEANHAATIAATGLVPAMRRRFTRNGHRNGRLFNADRVLSRFWDYPSLLRQRRAEFDLFHIVDHSYAQLARELPSEKTIVTCHDLDAFRSVLNGEGQRRSFLYNSMARRIMSGLTRAARVTCDSNATRDELLAYGLVRPERAVVVPNGVHPSCSPQADSVADEEATRLLGSSDADTIEILHVGSTIARKGIDVLLRVFAEVRKQFASARLIRAGGPFTPAQSKLAEQLEVAGAIIVLPHLNRNVLAAIYRRAAVVLMPSEREGFGLPVIEAMACGTPVVASDLPVLREVGGEAAVYSPPADLSAWTVAVNNLVLERHQRPEEWGARRDAGIAQAAKFSWAEYTEKMVGLYHEILT